jgi:hypothetical protein
LSVNQQRATRHPCVGCLSGLGSVGALGRRKGRGTSVLGRSWTAFPVLWLVRVRQRAESPRPDISAPQCGRRAVVEHSARP